jgi:hypothetical protein
LAAFNNFVLAFVCDLPLDRHAEQPLEDVERPALGIFAFFDALGNGE